MFPTTLLGYLKRNSSDAIRRRAPEYRSSRRFASDLERLEDRTVLSVDYWTGASAAAGGTTNWSNGGNWSLGVAPRSTDVADFASSKYGASTVDVSFTVAQLVIEQSWGGNIGVPAALTVTSLFTMDSGTFGGSGAMTIGGIGDEWSAGQIVVGTGGLDFVKGSLMALTDPNNATLQGGGTFVDAGTIDQRGVGNLVLISPINATTTLTIAAGGTYDFKTDSGILGGSGGIVNNAGILYKTGGIQTSTITATFNNNNGMITVGTGTLAMDTSGGAYTNGTYLVAGGAALDLTGSDSNVGFNLLGVFTAQGNGKIELNAGYLTALPGNQVLNIPSTVTFDWSGRTIYVPTNATLQYNGTITTTNALNVNVVLSGGGTLTLNGAFDQQDEGNLQIVGTSTVATSLDIAAGSKHTIDRNDADILQGGAGGGVINNSGLIDRTGSKDINGPGGSVIGAVINNNGTLQVDGGTLNYYVPNQQTRGAFVASAGATFDLYTGFNDFTLNPGASFSGVGLFDLNPSGGGTLTLGTNVSVPNFEFSGGTINGPGNLTLSNSFVWAGGSLSGTGVVTVPAHSTLSMPNTTTLYLNQTLINAGMASRTGTSNLQASAGGALINQAGAVFNAATDVSFNGGAFNNAGVYNKTSPGNTGTSYFGGTFSNSGTVNVGGGILQLDGGGTDAGTFSVATGQELSLTGGNHYLLTGTNFTGSGLVTLTGGDVTTGPAGGSFAVGPTVAFQWHEGAISVPVSTTETVTGSIALFGSSDQVLNGGGTLNLAGSINQTGSGSLRIDGTSTTSTTLDILAGSTYNIQNDSGIHNGFGYGGVLINSGTLEKTGGVGTSNITASFQNRGASLAVTGGTLQLAPVSGFSTGATFAVASGAILELTGGQSVNYTGSYTGSGSGRVLLNSGTLNVLGGSLGATFSLPAGQFIWSGGAINTNGSTFRIGAGNSVAVTGVGGEILGGGGMLSIAGSVVHSGAGNLRIDNGTTLSIATTGNSVFTSDAGIQQGYNAGGIVFNAGTLAKSFGTNVSTISTPLNNIGQVIATTGTLNVSDPVSQVAGTALNGGSWLAIGSPTARATLSLSGSPALSTIDLGSTVMLTGPDASFTNLSALSANDGSLLLPGGQGLSIPGNFTNAGNLTPGPGSVMAIAGNFTQTSSATLTVQIGGTNASPLVGEITVGSPMKGALGGTLVLSGTVEPATGTVLTILGNAGGQPVTGSFAGLPEGSAITIGAHKVRISYVGGTSGHDVTLTYIS